MFKHRGKNRTFGHNLRLAALLSFVAGMVNITGVLSVKVLTTNVTGHFAYFAEETANEQYWNALAFLFYILSFLFGSFLSNVLIELVAKRNPRIAHTPPMLIEIALLIFIGFKGAEIAADQLIACILLFAMGMQNSLVTQVSQSMVRTTHLTGLFTDLGIELSQLFLSRTTSAISPQKEHPPSFKYNYLLFTGCIGGGFLYKIHKFETLIVAAILLIIALFYDTIKMRFYQAQRKLRKFGK